MKKGLTIVIAIVTLLGLALALSACSKGKGPSKTQQAPGQQKTIGIEEYKKGLEESKKHVVAKVNGADITLYALLNEMNRVAPAYIKPGQTRSPETDAKVKKEALNNLIFKELAAQEAVKEGIRMQPEMLNEEVKKIKTQLGSEEAYQRYLQNSGLTEDSLKKEIERDYLFQTAMRKEVSGKINVSDKVLREVYEREKKSLLTNDNPPRQMTFEEAKGPLAREIRAEKGQEIITAWEEGLRKNARIEIFLAEVEKKFQGDSAKSGKR